MQNIVYHRDFNYENIWMHKNKDQKLQKKKIVFRHGVMCIFSPKIKTVSHYWIGHKEMSFSFSASSSNS